MIEYYLDNLLQAGIAPLAHKFDENEEMQKAYVTLHSSRAVEAEYSSNLDNLSPEHVTNREALSWNVPAQSNGKALYDLLTSEVVNDLFCRVYSGHELNNGVWQLGDDAQEAYETLNGKLNDIECDLVMCASEFIGDGFDYWSDDESLSQAKDNVINSALSQNIKVVGNISTWLLGNADYYVTNDKFGLSLTHLHSLLKNECISQEEFDDYVLNHLYFKMV